MTIIAVVLLIALGLLWSEYSAKARYVRELQDAIDIAHAATGFVYSFGQVSKIYAMVDESGHPIDMQRVQEKLGYVVNDARYLQVYGDVEGINALRDYQPLGMLDHNKLDEFLEKIDEGEIEQPETLAAVWKALKRSYKV